MSNTRLQLISGAALIGIWAAIVFMSRAVPVESSPDPVAVDTPTSTTVTTGVPIVRVAASGRYAEEVLEPLTLRFMSGHDMAEPPHVEVVQLANETEVWHLSESTTTSFDIIEIGFRLDVFSDEARSRFLELDRRLLTNLGVVSDRFDLPINGVIPGVDGALAMFADARSSYAPVDWADLVEAARSGVAVAVPGPPLSISVVFVWALGLGDADLGLERYQRIVDAGGRPVTTTEQLRGVMDAAPTVGAWSSSGIVALNRDGSTAATIAPSSGLVPLPAFTGILAKTDDPAAAHRWLNFRLAAETQSAMTFRSLIRNRNETTPVPWGPVVDVSQDPTALIGFDPLRSPVLEVDWAALHASVDEVTTELQSIVDQ